MIFSMVICVLASDDLLIYSQRLNNGWQDWGWVPHYATNNPAPPSGTNCVVFAASGAWQAWYLVHDPVDTTLYTNLIIWMNGGATGGQSVGVQVASGGSWGNRIAITAPTNRWQQFTISLASLGVDKITNFTAIQIWNYGALQSNIYIANISLAAAPAPAFVHVGVNATNPIRTVNANVFGINQVA